MHRRLVVDRYRQRDVPARFHLDLRELRTGADRVQLPELPHQPPASKAGHACREIQANTGSIIDLAVYTDAMPQGGDLPLAQRMQLGEWLACGAP